MKHFFIYDEQNENVPTKVVNVLNPIFYSMNFDKPKSKKINFL